MNTVDIKRRIRHIIKDTYRIEQVLSYKSKEIEDFYDRIDKTNDLFSYLVSTNHKFNAIGIKREFFKSFVLEHTNFNQIKGRLLELYDDIGNLMMNASESRQLRMGYILNELDQALDFFDLEEIQELGELYDKLDTIRMILARTI